MNTNNKNQNKRKAIKGGSQRTSGNPGQQNLRRTVKVQDSRVIKAPVAQTTQTRTALPEQKRLPNGDVIVSHREFIQDIAGSVDFAVTGLAINPGVGSTFPWLATLASLYESYKFDELMFEFKTMSSTSSTGTVMMAVDYDASDPAPVSKQQLASYQGNVRSSPWENVNQRSTSANLGKRSSYYNRSGPLTANQDVKLYDTGNLFLATQGQAGTSAVGELYVAYKVRLMTPQLSNPAVGLSKSSRINYNVGSIQVVPGSSAPLNPDGTLLPAGDPTLTATMPYNCLVALSGALSAGTPVPAFGGTATIQSVVSVVNALNYEIVAEVAFLAGQTLTIDLGADQANATAAILRIAQFNVLVL